MNYGNAVFWDKRYKEVVQRFDWLKGYSQLKPILTAIIRSQSNILYAGCGNSTLSENLYDDGFTNIMNIDWSKQVIKQMKERNSGVATTVVTKYENKKRQMKFVCADVKKLDFKDESFDFVIEKCLLDSVFCSEDYKRNVFKTLREISRVLKVGGKLIGFSYAFQQPREVFFRTRLVKFEFHYFALSMYEAALKKIESGERVQMKGKDKEHYCYMAVKTESTKKASFSEAASRLSQKQGIGNIEDIQKENDETEKDQQTEKQQQQVYQNQEEEEQIDA